MENITTLIDEHCVPTAGANAIGQQAADSLAGTLKALADPLRLRMLSEIASSQQGEACVCDLAELADVAQPTVSHHLKVMKDVGILNSERRGTWVWYSINPERRTAITTLLEAFAPITVTTLGANIDESDSGSAGQLPDLDDRITRLAEELVAGWSELDPALVLALVRESYASLVRTAKIPQHLLVLTERFAKQRLADVMRNRERTPPQVLFVCVANAGRSQLAAALVNQLSGGSVVARSAGSAPATDIHPHVRTLLNEIEGDLANERFPKPLTDDAVRAADVVVTMGCGDVCPIIPGVRYEDWAVGDPALASAKGAAAIKDDITARVHNLITALTSSKKKESL